MATAAGKCPPIDHLARFVLGQLSEWEAEAVQLHMEHCQPCSEKFGKQNEGTAKGDLRLVTVKKKERVGSTKVAPKFQTQLLPDPSFQSLAEVPSLNKQPINPTETPAPRLRAGPLPTNLGGEPVNIYSSVELVAANEFKFLRPPLHNGDLGQLGPYRVLQELGRGGHRDRPFPCPEAQVPS